MNALVLPLLVGVAFFGVSVVVLDRRTVVSARRRISAYVDPRNLSLPQERPAVLISRFQRPLEAAEKPLSRLPQWHRVQTLVERSALPLRAVELVAAAVCAAVVIAVLGFAAGTSPAAVLVLELLGVALLRGWLALRISRRRHAFEDQLPELLHSLGSALRAGHGLNQALAAVAADSAEPASSEFARVLAEARLGRPLEDALADLAARIRSEDVDFVLDAIVIQRQVGGSLAGIFEIVGESVRQRQQFTLKLRSLTAMGRMSGLVLVALPFVLAVVLSLLNPSYLAPLATTSLGHTMVAVALVLIVVGTVWLRSVVSMKGLKP